ncbi:MAG TPA: EamA family transporter [Terriglobales bacterium]|nr:EamA family transporter [Terriglobales bacterium]
MTFRKYLVLAGVSVFASIGDSMLSRGMKDMGGVSLARLHTLLAALRDPWIVGGIVFLLAFFAAYMTALSWADLTYVLPATSLGYVLLALIAKFVLHEQVTMLRWVGIFLIAVGVSAVASGPELTQAHQREPEPELAALQEEP